MLGRQAWSSKERTRGGSVRDRKCPFGSSANFFPRIDEGKGLAKVEPSLFQTSSLTRPQQFPTPDHSARDVLQDSILRDVQTDGRCPRRLDLFRRHVDPLPYAGHLQRRMDGIDSDLHQHRRRQWHLCRRPSSTSIKRHSLSADLRGSHPSVAPDIVAHIRIESEPLRERIRREVSEREDSNIRTQ